MQGKFFILFSSGLIVGTVFASFLELLFFPKWSIMKSSETQVCYEVYRRVNALGGPTYSISQIDSSFCEKEKK